MKNSEEALEKVLAGLGNVETPDGMERRILKSLDDALDGSRLWESRRTRSGSRRMLSVRLGVTAWPMGRRQVICGFALAGAIVLGVTITSVRRGARATVESKASVAPSKSRAESVRHVAPLEAMAGSKVVEKSAPLFSTGTNVRSGPHAQAMEEGNERRAKVDDMDALALEEMRAASQPAPPMPLTEQERLLLRFARQGASPGELAALDPARRAAQDREERAEVERFFDPKTTEANE